MLEHPVPEGLYSVEGALDEAIHGALQSVGRNHIVTQIYGDCLLLEILVCAPNPFEQAQIHQSQAAEAPRGAVHLEQHSSAQGTWRRSFATVTFLAKTLLLFPAASRQN